jgi:hypothetical protein
MASQALIDGLNQQLNREITTCEGPLGRHYVRNRGRSPFYRDAVFYSSAEVDALLRDAGFIDPVWVQTLFAPVDTLTSVDPVREGRGAGGFVVVRALRG